MAQQSDLQQLSRLREYLRSPITVVTSAWQGKRNAQIVTSVRGGSVVPERPRFTVSIAKRNLSHSLISRSKAFALCFIGPEQLQFVHDFGLRSGRDHEKLAGVPHTIGVTGCPILAGCWAYAECRVLNAMDAGAGTLFLGEVVAGELRGEPRPLWWHEVRERIPEAWRWRWQEVRAEELAFTLAHMDEIDYTPWRP